MREYQIPIQLRVYLPRRNVGNALYGISVLFLRATVGKALLKPDRRAKAIGV